MSQCGEKFLAVFIFREIHCTQIIRSAQPKTISQLNLDHFIILGLLLPAPPWHPITLGSILNVMECQEQNLEVREVLLLSLVLAQPLIGPS